MKLTWEDRKGYGEIDGHTLTDKPAFSFEYAWFYLDDEIAEFVESHDYGYWNKEMTPEQSLEVKSFYNDWSPPQPAPPTQQELLYLLEEQRKQAEAEGVIVSGIRYAGDPGNRQALLEVVQFARESGVETFPMWKDSDNQFHPNHPLAEVEQALMQIAARRSNLIALEGQYAAHLLDGTLDAIDDLSWEVS